MHKLILALAIGLLLAGIANAGLSDYVEIDFGSLNPATFYDIPSSSFYQGATIPVLSGHLPWEPLSSVELSLEVGAIAKKAEFEEWIPVVAGGADLTVVAEWLVNKIPGIEVDLPDTTKLGYFGARDFDEDKWLHGPYFGFKIEF